MKAVNFALAAALAVGTAGAAFAEQQMKVTERFSGTGVAFDLGETYSGVSLTVIGPDDYYVGVVSEKGAPAVDLRKGGTLSDGVYTYQLSGATATPKKVVRDYFNNGRDRGAEPMVQATTSGSFVVQKGSIVKFDDTPERESR